MLLSLIQHSSLLDTILMGITIPQIGKYYRFIWRDKKYIVGIVVRRWPADGYMDSRRGNAEGADLLRSSICRGNNLVSLLNTPLLSSFPPALLSARGPPPRGARPNVPLEG